MMDPFHGRPITVGGLHGVDVLPAGRNRQRHTRVKIATEDYHNIIPPFGRLPLPPGYCSSPPQNHLIHHPSGLPQLHYPVGGLSFSGGKNRQSASHHQRTRKEVRPSETCITRNTLNVPCEELANRPCENSAGGHNSPKSDNCKQSAESDPSTRHETLARNRQRRARCRPFTPCHHSRPFTPYSYRPTFCANSLRNGPNESYRYDTFLESLEASASETCSFEDALSTISHSSSSSTHVAQVTMVSNDVSSSDSLILSSVNLAAVPIIAHRSSDSLLASELNRTPEQTSPKENEPRRDQSPVERSNLEMTSMSDSTPNPSRGEPTSTLSQHYSDVCVLPPRENDRTSSPLPPQSPLIKGRRPDSFEIQIPGRYFSIHEDFQEDLSISLEGAGRSPPSSSHTVSATLDKDSPIASESADYVKLTPAASLIDLLNQWQKVPTTQELPECFVKKLRDALDKFENWRSIELDDQRASTLTGTSFQSTSSSGSCRSLGSTRPHPSQAGVILAARSHSKSIDQSSDWTPFSERSRIPASRQIGPTVKFQILPHRTWLAATPTSDMLDDFPASPSSKMLVSPLVSKSTNDTTEAIESSFKDQDRPARRKKNLENFLGTSFGPTSASKTNAEIAESVHVQSHRKSDRKPSLTAEITKTVKGLKHSKYHLSLPNKNSEPFKHKHSEPLNHKSDGISSDCNHTSNRRPSLQIRSVNHRRLNSDVGNAFDKLRITDSSQKLATLEYISKKTFGMRFESSAQ